MWLVTAYVAIWATTQETISSDRCAQRRRRFRSAWHSQSEPSLGAFRITKMQSFFMRTTKSLLRLRGCAGWFESTLCAHVRKSSHVAAHKRLVKMYFVLHALFAAVRYQLGRLQVLISGISLHDALDCNNHRRPWHYHICLSIRTP